MIPPEAPAASRRRDQLSPWVILLLVLLLGRQLYDVGVAPFFSRTVLHRPLTSATDARPGEMDSDAMQDLIQVDLQTKTAYLTTLARPTGGPQPDVTALRTALKAADDLQRETRNSPGAARRVLLVRALFPPGKDAAPPLAAGKNGLAPLDAFGPALPRDLPPSDRARYAAEARLWQTVFAGGRLTPAQIADADAQIRRLPRLHWWTSPALSALYAGQGDAAQAGRFARQARDRALPSVVPVVLLLLVRLGFLLVGLGLLLYLLIRAVGRRKKPDAPAGADLWPTAPPALPDAQRRLGAGDLMGVFVLYLLTRELISLLIGGFGLGRLHVPGLIAPFKPALAHMAPAQRTTVGIVLNAAVYVLSALPSFLALWAMARRRGASLADEIGWTRRRLGANVLYGLGGFAIASALMLPVALVARRLFQHAPDPSNPVIPQIMNTTGFWGPFLLVVLASVCAPIIEEFLFRGVLYQAARQRLGVWPAIVVTGLVFGFVHPVGVAEMLAIATLGGVFAWMAETRQSLAPSMTAHFLQNFFTTMILLSVMAG